jgi:hypothetical protein
MHKVSFEVVKKEFPFIVPEKATVVIHVQFFPYLLISWMYSTKKKVGILTERGGDMFP